jgi:hypothetical protein
VSSGRLGSEAPGSRETNKLPVQQMKGTPFLWRRQQYQEPAMEALSRLVTESLVRHGFDRPLDYRRLHWSRWFRCESHHSLLFVPSQPGVFAVAEEITSGAPERVEAVPTHVATGALPVPRPLSEAKGSGPAEECCFNAVEERRFSAASAQQETAASAAVPRRLLAVTQFFEDDNMAFVLDRMLSTQNPMRARLASGRYFVRFVVIEDPTQRRSICSALNQWMVSSAEKASGIGSHFATSLELTPATEYVPEPNEAQTSLFEENASDVAQAPSPPSAGASDAHLESGASPDPRTLSEAKGSSPVEERRFSAASSTPQEPAALAAEGHRISAPARSSTATASHLDSGAATNIHCPSPLPSGF